MTPKRTFATSPRHAPEPLMNLPPKEGVGNAGRPLHPRPHAHLVVVETSSPRNGFAVIAGGGHQRVARMRAR
jgi:hypothetical protein